jgi:hypothetical protein
VPSLAAPILGGGPFYEVPPRVSTTISIRPASGEVAHKVTKIVGYPGAGLSLLAPYHAAKSGLLTKTRCDYSKRRLQLTLEDQEVFTAGNFPVSVKGGLCLGEIQTPERRAASDS